MSVQIADLSEQTQFGVKGSGAADWLRARSIPIPEGANRWQRLATGGIVARLGLTEFLITDPQNSQVALSLIEDCQLPPAKVYPVLRQDMAIAVSGSKVPDLMLQTCSFNFRALDLSQQPVILTTMVGVSVTVIPSLQAEVPLYRIWCDGTFGAYLWRTLLSITEELGGGAIAADFLLPLAQNWERGLGGEGETSLVTH
jgi:sarcosine oxidase, subunit gamma